MIDFLESERDVRLHLGVSWTAGARRLDPWRVLCRLVIRVSASRPATVRPASPGSPIVGLTSDERVIAGGFSFA